MIDENTYLKHRTICKKCHNENRRKNNNTLPPNKNNTSYQQPNTENVNKMFQHVKTIVMSLSALATL